MFNSQFEPASKPAFFFSRLLVSLLVMLGLAFVGQSIAKAEPPIPDCFPCDPHGPPDIDWLCKYFHIGCPDVPACSPADPTCQVTLRRLPVEV